ncbi:hypothetical protein F5148DRAFT_1189967 [Russula earlei]|uniref:Uncharacterized protein n=1 Tax=Russula earlei TaxID=71964 RepID=A0ACC0UD01_9AGAM|nr:hypothetical protein F5148DRAFT_1189967 [Russula earlei]
MESEQNHIVCKSATSIGTAAFSCLRQIEVELRFCKNGKQLSYDKRVDEAKGSLMPENTLFLHLTSRASCLLLEEVITRARRTNLSALHPFLPNRNGVGRFPRVRSVAKAASGAHLNLTDGEREEPPPPPLLSICSADTEMAFGKAPSVACMAGEKRRAVLFPACYCKSRSTCDFFAPEGRQLTTLTSRRKSVADASSSSCRWRVK